MIVGVACRLATGEIRSLPKPARHPNLSAEYNKEARKKGWDFPWEGWPGQETLDSEQGFVTETGEFLNRKEAAKHAWVSGQIDNPGLELFSEDVW